VIIAHKSYQLLFASLLIYDIGSTKRYHNSVYPLTCILSYWKVNRNVSIIKIFYDKTNDVMAGASA